MCIDKTDEEDERRTGGPLIPTSRAGALAWNTNGKPEKKFRKDTENSSSSFYTRELSPRFKPPILFRFQKSVHRRINVIPIQRYFFFRDYASSINNHHFKRNKDDGRRI